MLNVVTIGTSFITDLFLQAVEQLEGIRCTGMYTRTRDHALALAQRHGVCAIYTDLDEMLASDADIVYIASPNALHAEHAEKALRAGSGASVERTDPQSMAADPGSQRVPDPSYSSDGDQGL